MSFCRVAQAGITAMILLSSPGYSQSSVTFRFPMEKHIGIVPSQSKYFMDTITLLSGDQLVWQVRLDLLKQPVYDTISVRIVLSLRNLSDPGFFHEQRREKDHELSPYWYMALQETYREVGDETRMSNDGRRFYKFGLWINALLKLYMAILTDPAHRDKADNWLMIR